MQPKYSIHSHTHYVWIRWKHELMEAVAVVMVAKKEESGLEGRNEEREKNGAKEKRLFRKSTMCSEIQF